MNKSLIGLSAIIFLTSGFVWAQEEFPYVAEVIEDQVNVRAGQDKSFEAVGRVAKGTEVVVVGKEYHWYKVKLPDTAKCFVSTKYIKVHQQGIGEMTGSRVNVRAGTGENFTSLGQLPTGTLVRIRNKKNQWFEIEPLEGTYGWISEELLKFKSKTIPPAKTVQIPPRNIYVRKRILESEMRTREEALAKEKKKELFSAVGTINRVDENDLCQEFHYKIVESELTKYFLQGPDHIFDQFLPNKVKVEGELDTENKQYPQPVIKVTRIAFIL